MIERLACLAVPAVDGKPVSCAMHGHELAGTDGEVDVGGAVANRVAVERGPLAQDPFGGREIEARPETESLRVRCDTGFGNMGGGNSP